MGLKNEEGRKINQKSKKGKTEEAEPKGKFLGKWITCAKIFSCGLGRRKISSAVPCRGVPPCRRALPCRGLLPWRCSRSRWHFGTGLRALLMRLLCSCTSQQARYQQRKKHSSAPGSRRLNYELTPGAALGAALRSDCRVHQGDLRPTPYRQGGVIFDDDHCGLGPLRRSLGQCSEKKRVQIGASQIQDINSKIEGL